MAPFKSFPRFILSTRLVASSSAAAAMVACGGGGQDSSPAVGATSPVSASSVSFQLSQADASASTGAGPLTLPADVRVEPSFHVAPVELDAPGDIDVLDHSASSRQAPHTTRMPDALAGLNTRGLTLQGIQSARRSRAAAAIASNGATTAAPLASSSVVATYTPAQVRAAYGMPALPSSFTVLSAAQAAQFGAGQTIYLINAFHNPNVAAELTAFNQRFGLPGCTSQAIPVASALPIAAASATAGCVLSVVYSTAAGALSSAAPAYDAGWATEISLDVQWAHATAPLARIVLIEASDASNGLTNAIGLAGKMGPGVVSMSFGAPEGSWMASVDSVFTGTGMTYLAASGDSGAGVSWPAASTRVLAVGGTSLTYSGSGARSETAWSGSGGGISQYMAAPSYQTNQVPGLGSVAGRAVPDVAFNANPSTGQYVAVMSLGSSTASWISVGGTSLSTPQWAGIVATANAMRDQSGRAAIGLSQPTIYSQIALVPGTYASSFLDVVTGVNGPCATCASKTGFDEVTGLGTPQVSSLLSVLSGATVPPTSAPSAPTVTAGAVNGKVDTPLTYTVGYNASNPVRFALSGAPAGLAISNTGVLSWAKPVAGTYTVTVTATDSKTTLSGKAVLTISIATAATTPPTGPSITASALTGVVGKALTGTITIADPGATALSISISGVPPGVSFWPKGLVLTLDWPHPVPGTYPMTVSVIDNAGKSARLAVPITVNAR
ncbi:peptidase S53 [Sphaerotilus sp.]|uniref:peptidase S53 n=1 Tax=Sphaerotilus sp. TaxID=2093942 RepID=UPI0034E2F511